MSSKRRDGTRRVCILGAGPAGLVLALGLQRREGFHVTLVEQRESHMHAATYDPARSYTIDLTAHGMRALEHVGARARFERELLPFHGVRVVAPPFRLDDRHVGGGVTGSRGDICRALQSELELRGLGSIDLRFETRATQVDAERGLVRIGGEEREFDLVVGADGAGSGLRAEAGLRATSGAHTNHGSMIRLDIGVESMDPRWLYLLGMPPVMQVAGAINGPGGPSDPLWFCQIGTDGPLPRFDGPADANAWLEAHCPRVRRHASLDSIAAFAVTESMPTGRWKTLDTFVRGRVVLIGDAAAPFPPVGQGINAAMESATVLDRCIGESPDELILAAQRYEARWRPEARAVTQIAKALDLRLSLPGVIRAFVYAQLGVASVQNAKKNMSYGRALQIERRADAVFGILGLLAVAGAVAFLLRR